MGRNALRLRTFSDFVATLDGLQERFTLAQTAVLLDQRGHVRDLTLFTAPHHTHDAALDWAMCCVVNDGRVRSMVLLSAVRNDLTVLRDDDIRVYERMQEVFAECDVRVLDWILCNGELFRSMAFSTGSAAWEPPRLRSVR